VEKTEQDLFQLTNPAFRWKNIGKPHNTSVTITGVQYVSRDSN